jgi:hypothetical protein
MTEFAPPDSGYRWATVTTDDRSGVLYIIALLSFTYSSLTFITRCFIKWHVLGLDDAAAFVAQVSVSDATLKAMGLIVPDCQYRTIRPTADISISRPREEVRPAKSR